MASTDSNPTKDNNSLDWNLLINQCRRRWWWFAVSAIICTCIGFAYSKIAKPRFEVSASVLISDDGKSKSASVALLMSKFDIGSMFGGTSSVQNELAVMGSHTVFMNTVKDLGLNTSYIVRQGFMNSMPVSRDESPVSIAYPPAMPDTLSNAIKFKIAIDKDGKGSITASLKLWQTLAEVSGQDFPIELETSYGSFTFDTTEAYQVGKPLKETIVLGNYAGAAEAYQSLVQIAIANKKANILSLGMESVNPQFACDIISDIITNYNLTGINQTREKSTRTLTFLNGRIDTLTVELSALESQIEQYKKSRNLTDVTADVKLLLSRKEALHNKLFAAETEYEVMQLVKNFINDSENDYSLIPALGDSTVGVKGAIASYNRLIMERMKLESNAKANNTSLRLIDNQLAAMRGNITQSLDKSLITAAARLKELRREVARADESVQSLPSTEREFIEIKRRQAVQEQLYLYLLQQREEAALNIANVQPRGIVIDAPYVHVEPIGLSRMKILAIAFLLGLLIPAGYLFMRERMRTRMISQSDISRRTDITIIGETIDENGSTKVISDQESAAADRFRTISANLRFILGADGKTAMITSSTTGEGKTYVAVNTAAALAVQGLRTIIVAMDMSNSDMAATIGAAAAPGLSEYLSSNIPVSSVLRKSVTPTGLDAITAGTPPPNAAALLASPRLDSLIAELRDRYDYIIIDGPDTSGSSAVYSAARMADATICVCRKDVTLLSAIDMTATMSDKFRNLIIVSNATAGTEA